MDFATVDIFDINSYLDDRSSNGTWYSQKTTGDVPAPRIDFCTITISAQDNSSHHIYLYGGIDPITNTGYDDVLILTIPSFTWTNVWPIGESPRWGHNCHVAGKRQMLTVGGNNTLKCDWERKGVAVWELTALTWGSVFLTNLTNYQVPQRILDLTGGTPNGNATKKDPALGWTDQGLKTVFSMPRRNAASSPSPSTSSSPKNTNTAAIAGGVVGGVVGLALITFITIFLRRRYRRTHGPHELHNNSSPIGHEIGEGKNHFELQAVNENEPAELVGADLRELETPRQVVEADPLSSTSRAELSGTTTVAGGVLGVPIVRTPGDELPEREEYVAGLRRVGSSGSGSLRREESVTGRDRGGGERGVPKETEIERTVKDQSTAHDDEISVTR
jgi:hypothetical protein